MDSTVDSEIERLLAENRRLRKKSRLLDAILDNAPLLISAKDLKGNVLITSSHFQQLEGPTPEEFIGKNVFELFPKEIAKQLWDNDLKAQQSSTPIQAEEAVRHRDGTTHTYHTTKFPLHDEREHLIGTCAVSMDITNSKQLEKEVHHDFLTGLFNQRYLEEVIDRELARARREKQILVLAFIDLDNFKSINDSFGHHIGNNVLVAVANTLKSLLNRPDDCSFRLGGDEFCITFTVDKTESAKMLLKEVHQGIKASIRRTLNGTDVKCSSSIGVRFVEPTDEMSYQSLFLQIDKAMYQAKRLGKNRILYHR